MHIPADSIVTLVADTVHMVDVRDVKVTGKLELAVAETKKAPLP